MTDKLAILGSIEFASAAYDKFELIMGDIAGKSGELDRLKKQHKPNLKRLGNYLKTERNANYVHVRTYLKTLARIKRSLNATHTRHSPPQPR